MAEMFHMSAEEALSHHFRAKWGPSAHRSAPARGRKRRRKAPAWARKLRADPYSEVTFDQPIPCPSCGVGIKGLGGGPGEVADGGLVDVIRCSACRAAIVLDMREGTLRAPTEAERKRWRLTFWFAVMRESEGD